MNQQRFQKAAAILAVAALPLFSFTTCTLDTPSGLYVFTGPGLRDFEIEFDDDEIEIDFDGHDHHDDFFDRLEDWFD